MAKKLADIGVYGLGVMGSNLAFNFADNGYAVAVSNYTPDLIDRFMGESDEFSNRFTSEKKLGAFIRSIKTPRAVLIMIKSGAPVDQTIKKMKRYLDPGDTIIDGGNSDFHDTIRRTEYLEKYGIHFVGMGVSGGADGARHGPSMMFGGSKESWKNLKTILQSISAKYEGNPCCDRMGSDGAGHFVKTIHNGIEYADMQMIAEVYGIFRDGFGWEAPKIGDVFKQWNKGSLNSFLIEITGNILNTKDDITQKIIVDVIVDAAGQKGTGRWSAIEAQKLGVPASVIEAAVSARSISSRRGERAFADNLFGKQGDRSKAGEDALTIGELEGALIAGKVAAYAQGFAVLDGASDEYKWNLPLGTIAEIWRAGCIIRSSFLSEISKVYADDPKLNNLMITPVFQALIENNEKALRKVVSHAALAGLPVPALSSALSYLDQYRQTRGTANMIQGQRDYFGSHGFKRLDDEDSKAASHGNW